MHVEVVYALPDKQHWVHLELVSGATVGNALEALARLAPFDTLDLAAAPVGVFGRLVNRADLLEAGDRIEIYRALAMDPKEARRRRAGA